MTDAERDGRQKWGVIEIEMNRFILAALLLIVLAVLVSRSRQGRPSPADFEAWARNRPYNLVPVRPASMSVSWENYLEEADEEERKRWQR